MSSPSDTAHPFDDHLGPNPANYQPLTPLSLLARAAHVWPRHTAVIHGGLRRSYAELYDRSRRLASALAAENGWTVRRIKIDDGCYEIDGADADGRRIEVTVHPATLAVIEVEYEDDDGDRRRPDRGGKGND